MAQVLPLSGAGGVFGGGPAPQNGLLRAPVAQVPILFPHLRQKPSAPAPKSPYTCANPFSRKRPGLQSIDSQEILAELTQSNNAVILPNTLKISNLSCEIFVAEEGP